jgi:hypothetical protein
MACARCRHEAPHPMACRWHGRINRGWNPAYGSILLLPLALIYFASYTSWFLHSPRPSLSAMAAELPPLRFKTMASLVSLRWLMGWQAPGLAPKLKHGAALLGNMRPWDFIFFAVYALAGLVPPLSSFFLTYWSIMGSSWSTSLPTPLRWWPSSSTYVRCSWGCGRRCGCSGASSY